MSLLPLNYEAMPKIIEAASPDIRWHLFSLYWLVRFYAEMGVVVELGTCRGDSTRALLAGCNDAMATLYSIDSQDCHETVKQHTERMGLSLSSRIHFIQSDSIEAANHWLHASPSLLFVDTNHSYPETLNELMAWNRQCTINAVICGHDYCLDESGRNGVKRSVTEFQKQYPRYELEVRTNCFGFFILRPK